MSLKLGNSLCKHQSVIKVTRWNLKVISLRIPLHSLLLKQLYCYRNIHMYDFYDDARHHHRSQCKHWTAFKRKDPSLAWALLGTFWKPLPLDIF